MIDIAQIASQVTALITPAMAALGSSAAAEAFYKEFGKDAWHFVKSLWTRLEPAVHADSGLKQAVEAVQTAPTDKLNETVLSARLQQALQADASLRDDLVRIIEANKSKGSSEIQNYYEKVYVHVQTVQGDFVLGQVTKAK